MTMQQSNNSTNRPLVSVIMNCLNGEKYLKEAIDSVYAQTYKNWEIIFWDNASTDSSAEIAKSCDERLRYFRGEETIPLGAARNKALEQTRGKFIAFLDCDDLWLSYKLETQLRYLHTHPERGFLYSNAYVMQDRKRRLVYSMRATMPQGSVFRAFLTRYPVNLQTVVIRKTLLGNLDHWFDKKLDLCEEYDFFLRLLYKAQAGYQKEPLVVYRLHPDMSTVKNFHKFEEEKLYILNKFFKQIPKFNKKYQNEIRLFRAGVAVGQATEYMLRGEKSQAREAMRPYMFISTKHFVLYLMTYLPLFLYVGLQEMKGGIILRQRLRCLHQKNLLER